MFGFKKRAIEKRRQLVRDIAEAVSRQLGEPGSRHKFLPPTTLNGKIYLVTEAGTIFTLNDDFSGMPTIMKIRD